MSRTGSCLAATGLALLAASPAAALSCLRPDPVRSFQEAAAAPEAFVVLLGRLDFDAALMPGAGYQEGRADAHHPPPVPARFQGQGLGPDGFAPSSIGAVTLRPTCAGPWCGAVEPGAAWLLFAREAPGGWEVEVGPCGGTTFEPPAQAVLDRLAACMRGEACVAPEGARGGP